MDKKNQASAPARVSFSVTAASIARMGGTEEEKPERKKPADGPATNADAITFTLAWRKVSDPAPGIPEGCLCLAISTEKDPVAIGFITDSAVEPGGLICGAAIYSDSTDQTSATALIAALPKGEVIEGLTSCIVGPGTTGWPLNLLSEKQLIAVLSLAGV